MNHKYKDLTQIKEKLRSIIYLHASFNLRLLTIMIMKLQGLNILTIYSYLLRNSMYLC